MSFEPSIALYAKDNGLYFYKKIINEAPKYLKNNGCLIFEIMDGQTESVKKLFMEKGYLNIKITKDVSGKERVIEGRYLTRF